MRPAGWMLFPVALLILALDLELSGLSNWKSCQACLWSFGGAILLGVISFGWWGFLNGMHTMQILFARDPRPWVNREALVVLRNLQVNLLSMGALAAVGGMGQMLTDLSDPSSIGPSMAMALRPLFVGLLFSYGLCQPTLCRLAEVSGGMTEIPERLPHPHRLNLLMLTLLFLLVGMRFVPIIPNDSPTMVANHQESTQPTSNEMSMLSTSRSYILETMTVNLAGSMMGKSHYLKTRIALEVGSALDLEELSQRNSQILDIVLTCLTTSDGNQLLTLEGKFLLKEKILTRINQSLVSGRVLQVYFHEFVIQ